MPNLGPYLRNRGNAEGGDTRSADSQMIRLSAFQASLIARIATFLLLEKIQSARKVCRFIGRWRGGRLRSLLGVRSSSGRRWQQRSTKSSISFVLNDCCSDGNASKACASLRR
jgi:hypothetical protein